MSNIPIIGGSTPAAGLGKDEQAILDAVHGSGQLGERLKKDLLKQKNRAKFKLEVTFGKNRRITREALNTGAVLIWESGRRFHGGGDEKMYWCGWTKDWPFTPVDKPCGRPILTKFFNINHVVCPSCMRENFLDPYVKKRHINAAKRGGKDVDGLKRMPIVCGERIFNMSPMKLAELLARYWNELECNADLYLKFHPTDIRCRDVAEVKKQDVYDKARQKRNDGLLIYPLERIIADTTAGASLEKRFLAAITA
jgi:hypothetical protein